MATAVNTLGKRIQEARRRAGFKNAEEFAVALGVGYRTIQRWEGDASEPSIARLREISSLTGDPLAYFIGEVAA